MEHPHYRVDGEVPKVLMNEFIRLQQRFPSLRAWSLLSVVRKTDYNFVGACCQRLREIVLCRWLWDYNPPTHPDIMDVLYHEVGHALVDEGHGHDKVWVKMAKKVGCKHFEERMREYTTLHVPNTIRKAYGLEKVKER